MKTLLHRLLCWTGLICGGRIEHYRDPKGVWWLGLRCVRCGKFCSPIRSNHQDKP